MDWLLKCLALGQTLEDLPLNKESLVNKNNDRSSKL